MPAVLIGGAILAVVAALIFWPTGEEAATGAERAKVGSAAAVAPGGGAAGAAAGGVQARAVDDPIRRAPEPRLNPAVQFMPEGVGQAPGIPEPEVVPDFDDVEEEIAYYERKLELAIVMRDKRQQFVERMDKVRERAEQSADPQQALETLEGRKKIVDENLAKAQQKVDEIEAKLADLRR